MDDVLKGRLLFPKSCLKFPSCAEPLPVLDEQSSKLEPLPVRWVFSSKVGPPPFPHPATTLSTGMYSRALGPLRSRGGSLFRPLPISSFQLLPPACLCPSGLLVPCTQTGSTTSVSCEGSIERVTNNCSIPNFLSGLIFVKIWAESGRICSKNPGKTRAKIRAKLNFVILSSFYDLWHVQTDILPYGE